MKKRTILIFSLILILSVMAFPVQAQDGGDGGAEDELMALVMQANQNLRDAQYFSVNAIQRQDQLIASGVGLRRSELDRITVFESDASIQVDENGVPVMMEATLSQNDTRQVNNVTRTEANLTVDYELRLLDGENLYLRINGIEGNLGEVGQQSSGFFTGWVNLSEEGGRNQLADDLRFLTSDYAGIDFLQFLNLSAILDLGAGITWQPDDVSRIREIASEVDNQRIIVVDLDPVALLETLGLATFVDDEGLEGDANLMLQEMFEASTLRQTIVLEIDGEGVPTLASVETDLAVDVIFSDGLEPNEPDATDGVSLQLVQETSTIVTYDDIAREFEVAVPGPEIEIDTTCNSDTLAVTFIIINNGANMPEPMIYTLLPAGERPTEVEFQLEAGTNLVIDDRRNGEFTLEIPALEISESVSCVAAEEASEG